MLDKFSLSLLLSRREALQNVQKRALLFSYLFLYVCVRGRMAGDSCPGYQAQFPSLPIVERLDQIPLNLLYLLEDILVKEFRLPPPLPLFLSCSDFTASWTAIFCLCAWPFFFFFYKLIVDGNPSPFKPISL